MTTNLPNKARALVALAVLLLLPSCTAVFQMGRPKEDATIYIGPERARSAPAAVHAECEPYRRPALPNAPELDYWSDRELEDSDALAIRLATHITELRKHVQDLHDGYARAENEHLATCRIAP